MQKTVGSIGSILARIRYMVSIDSRTLALFRVLMGLLIIGDLLARASTFSMFYTEDGLAPQSLAQARTVDHAFSFFFLTTSTPVIAALFLLHGLIAIQLIVGYKTRLATILSFLFVISLDNHNPLNTSHADSLFRLIFFWAMFLPLGERWSIDAVHRGTPGRPSIANLASAAILLQMIYMYLVNGMLKTLSDSWTDGTATPIVFGLDDMTYFLAVYLREYPTLLGYGGTLWFGMLIASPLLLIFPGWLRAIFTSMFVIVHLSFALTVRIGGFGWVAIAGVILFLPGQVWDTLGRLADAPHAMGRSLHWLRTAGHRAGESLANVLPRLKMPVQVPAWVVSLTGTTLVLGAIVAVFVVSSTVHLHRWAEIERAPTTLEERIYEGTQMFRVNQALWTVFAPNPRSTDRYYVFPARTADGEMLDVYNDRPLTFDRPYRELQLQYGNYRERFYMNSSRRAGSRGQVNPILAEYICRTYREDHGIELTHLNMYEVVETITLDTITDPDARERTRRLYYQHGCGENEPEELEVPGL